MSSDLTDEQIVSMTDAELEAWSESQAVGPWEPNDVALEPTSRMVPITIRMPQELLAELKAEAALRQQPYQRYLKDLLLMALSQVQASRRRRPKPARLQLTDDQIQELAEHGELTVELRRATG
jgi:predicted DNA binding CopG/RHH family protein